MQHIVKDFRNDDKLRKSFNDLAKTTFGLDFEPWYQNGYWTERYNPYSIMMDGKIVANVSVNLTDFKVGNEVKHYIQLGTVMTYEEYRNRGLIRKIMEEIDKDFEGKVDGMYLFAGEDVSKFYPKFGFNPTKEYQYIKNVVNVGECQFKQIPMNNKEQWDKLNNLIKKSYINSDFDMVDNSELNMFYISGFMMENVYYNENLDVYVIASIDGEELLLQKVISDKKEDLHAIISAFGENIKCAKLDFAPICKEGFEVQEYVQEDCTLHVKWEMDVTEELKFKIPGLAHA